MADENPFEILDLDPVATSEELTEELRRRVERASESERMRLQEAWRRLTMKEEERVRLALLTHPRAPAGRDPVRALRDAVPPYITRRKPPELVPTVEDVLLDTFDVPAAIAPPDPWKDS